MKKYTPIEKANQIIVGTGKLIIICGWTPKNAIARLLDPADYAAIGQLYSSSRGITFLIKNLLANPDFNQICLISRTAEDLNSGSIKLFFDFLRNGFYATKDIYGHDIWQIRHFTSKLEGFIDSTIPREALESLRSRIKFHFLAEQNLSDLGKKLKVLASNARTAPLPTKIAPLILPPGETQNKPLLPGSLYGHKLEGTTVASTWVKILHLIRTTGKMRPTGYDGQIQELIDLVAVVSNEPKDYYFPEPNYLPIDREYLKNYIPQIVEDAPFKPGVKYTYGQRLRSYFGEDQVEQVIEKLINEYDAASAVMSLWDVKDHKVGGSPCLNHVWVRIVGKELSLTATFRSNDMFSAWPANAMGLIALQRHIIDELNDRKYGNTLTPGPLITISQSAHIYDDCWQNVDNVLAKHYKYRPTFYDPCGNFIITVEGQEIKVEQVSTLGAVVKTFWGKNSLELVRAIAHSSPAIQPDHIGYLGIELEKAYNNISLKNHRYNIGEYEQDR